MTPAEDKFFRGRITERKEFSEDLWMIRVDPGGDFRFVAGQYATLGVQASDKLSERPYSIVSAPFEKQLEFFIELVPHGELTPLLYKLHVGDEMFIRKVSKGRFTLDTKSGHTNHFLLCTVTGVAPFVSYVRSLSKSEAEGTFKGEHKLFLVEGASRSWELGYQAELEKAAASHSWLKYVPTVSRPWEDEKWTGETGRVDELIRKYSDLWGLEPSNTTIYLCGNPDMIENGKGILKRKRFAKESMKEEVYWIPGKEPETLPPSP